MTTSERNDRIAAFSSSEECVAFASKSRAPTLHVTDLISFSSGIEDEFLRILTFGIVPLVKGDFETTLNSQKY